jgi:hypothetical protein
VEISRTAPKWTIVGVAKAPMVSGFVSRRRSSATSAMTTNWSPVSAAPEDPTIT